MIDEKALIEVSLSVHLLGIVLVNMSNVLVKITLIKHSMKAFAGSIETVRIALDTIAIANSLVRQW